jgi:hypothetical protein
MSVDNLYKIDFRTLAPQGWMDRCGGLGPMKLRRPLSVITNLGYDNFFFLFLVIIKHTN